MITIIAILIFLFLDLLLISYFIIQTKQNEKTKNSPCSFEAIQRAVNQRQFTAYDFGSN